MTKRQSHNARLKRRREWSKEPKHKLYVKKYKKDNAEKCRIQARDYRTKLKTEMITAYGGRCACCGETEPKFLTLDHINNDGAKERRKLGHRSCKIRSKLRGEGWPKDRYQILCWNCNCAKGTYGQCPHQK